MSNGMGKQGILSCGGRTVGPELARAGVEDAI